MSTAAERASKVVAPLALAIAVLVLLALPSAAAAAAPPVTNRIILGPFRFGCQMVDEGAEAWVYCSEGPNGSTRHVRLDPSGEVSLSATEPLPTGIGGPGDPYGAWLVTGRFRCQVLRQGIECVVIASGKGFVITRNRISEVQAAPGVTEPAPVLGKSAVVEPTAGSVLFKEPGTKFVRPLNTLTVVPVGSQFDTTRGTVELTAATSASGETQSGRFRGGIFRFTQPSGKAAAELPAGLTVLTLTGRPRCGAGASASSGAKKPPRLWGNAHGNFETEGRNATATVRGTRWLTKETCAGTLVKVARGVVAVTDRVTHRTVNVTAGHSYLAGSKAKPLPNEVPVLGKPNFRTKGLGQPHPRAVYFGGDALSVVEEIRWDSWGGPRAVGHGSAWYLPHSAKSVSEGHSEAATIVAFDLGPCNGKLAYRQLEWFFPAHGGSFKARNGTPLCL